MPIFNIDLGKQKRADIEADLYKKKRATDLEAEKAMRAQIFQEITQRILEADPNISAGEATQKAAQIAIGERAAIAAEAKNRVAMANAEAGGIEELGREKMSAVIQGEKAKRAKGLYEQQFSTASDPALAANAANAELLAKGSAAQNLRIQNEALTPGIAEAALAGQKLSTAELQGKLGALPSLQKTEEMNRIAARAKSGFDATTTLLQNPQEVAKNLEAKGLIERVVGTHLITHPEDSIKIAQPDFLTRMTIPRSTATNAIPGFVTPQNRTAIKRTIPYDR